MSLEKHHQESVRWLKQARSDVRAAHTSRAGGNYEWASFQSQQAAEKAVKALWYYHGADPRGHSIVKLLQSFPCRDRTPLPSELMQEAKRLDKLYIPTRYPNGLPDMIPAEVYAGEEAAEAIGSAERIIEFVGKIIITKNTP